MDSSPTALFDSYEQDFQQFIDSIREKLEGSGKDEVGGELALFLSLAERTNHLINRRAESNITAC
jgi:vesicle transport through interaction with t-SNAREs protein 1